MGMSFGRIAAAALLLVFATTCVNAAVIDAKDILASSGDDGVDFTVEMEAREARETILSFDLFDFSGTVNRLGDGGDEFGRESNATVTIGLSNGQTFNFTDMTAETGAWNAENGVRSMVLIRPSDQDNMEEAVGRNSGEKLFRAMINDAENGMMYEFMPNVATGEMIVVARDHSDLPDSSPEGMGVRQPILAINQWKKFSNIVGHDSPGEQETPTVWHTRRPTRRPTNRPTKRPTWTWMPTRRPSRMLTRSPTARPTKGPTRLHPSPVYQRPQSVPQHSVSLMVVWTQRAECANAHPNWNPAPFPCNLTPRTEAAMLATVELAVAQSNAILQNSGVASRIRLVHAYRDNRYVESHVGGHDMFDTAVDAVTYTEDGIMDDVHTRRRQYGAQIVSMFVYDPSYRYCGMAWQGKGKPMRYEKLFTAVDFRCATSRYDLLHEIGHLLGSKHDRGTKGVCTKNLDEIHYGYRHPQYPFRTVLAYDCRTREAQCDNSPHRNSRHGCSILPILSGPDSKIVVSDPWGRPMEITMGDESNNNAQIFRVGLRQI